MLDKLKLRLISRFHPLSWEQVDRYQCVLLFNSNGLLRNESIPWTIERIEQFGDRIHWPDLHYLRKVRVDRDFVRRNLDRLMDCPLAFHRDVEWDDELIESFLSWQSRFESVLSYPPFSSVKYLLEYADRLDWSSFSRRVKPIDWTEFMVVFEHRVDWEELSMNPRLPASADFIKRYADRWNFDMLSSNPAMAPLIEKYPQSKSWDLEKATRNSGLHYTAENLPRILSCYRNYLHQSEPDLTNVQVFIRFLNNVFSVYQVNQPFLLSERHYSLLPWQRLPSTYSGTMNDELVKYIWEKFVAKKRPVADPRVFASYLSTRDIEENIELFNINSYDFYSLSLSQEFVCKHGDNINWHRLSSCRSFDWDEEFIVGNISKLWQTGLAANEGVYSGLFGGNDRLVERFLDRLMDQ